MKLLIVLFLILSPLFADKHKSEMHHFPLDITYLQLSEQQYTKLVKILKKFRHERKKFHKEEKATREEISKLFVSETFKQDEFIRRIQELKRVSIERQADFFVKMHQLLTPHQRKRFAKYMKEWELD